MESIELSLADTPIVLSSDRTAFLPGTRTLLLADLHLGKDSTFRQSGIYVPTGVTEKTLSRWQAAIDHSQPTQCFVLGDIVHAASSLIDAVFDQLDSFLISLQSQVAIHLIVGNHDKSARSRLAELPFASIQSQVDCDGFTLVHDPQEVDANKDPFQIGGHVHPCVRLSARGFAATRLPCFWVRSHSLVLPAFGEFTGGAVVKVADDDDAYMICDNELIQLQRRRDPQASKVDA